MVKWSLSVGSDCSELISGIYVSDQYSRLFKDANVQRMIPISMTSGWSF